MLRVARSASSIVHAAMHSFSSNGIEAFVNELSKYEGGKGSKRFPINEPLPLDLIGRIVKFRVAENLKKAGKYK